MSSIEFEPLTDRQGCTCLILARDNADTIRRALDSALASGCFDEILVLMDIRSRDGTGRIVHEYRKAANGLVRIIPYRWADPPNFAEARNYLNLHVRTPYAFWLDADEELTGTETLRALLNAANGQAFWMTVTSPLPGGSVFNMYQPRLFPVRPGVIFECPVFERLDWSLERMGIPSVKTQKALILHYGYMQNEAVQAKNRRNAAILRHSLPRYHGGIPQHQHMENQYDRLIGS